MRAIEEHHWDEARGAYADVGARRNGSVGHVDHTGYVSVFPFLLQLDASTAAADYDPTRIGRMLDLLEDTEGMLSDFGLRSLSKKDRLYGTGENYWRGKVWLNMNVLALRALRALAARPTAADALRSRAAALRENLRRRLVDNMSRQHASRGGMLFENYDDTEGTGTGCKPFTGWSACIVLEMV